MSEYISRDAAISKIRDQGVLGGDYDAYEREEDVVDMLNSIPAADVVEVRHGRWVDEKYVWQGKKSAQCNQCKRKTDYYIQPEYCPHCGAKMDGGMDNG